MNPNYLFLIASFFVLFSINANGQVKDKSYYFDDNGISTSQNIIKTDVGALFHKEASLLWEHSFSKRLSFETGAGIIIPSYTQSYFAKWVNIGEYKDIQKAGVSLSFQGRYYYSESLKLSYISAGIKHRLFPNLHVTDFMTGVGIQYHIGNRIKLDMSLNVSLRHQRSLDGTTYLFDKDSEYTAAVPILFKLGYLL